MRTITTLMATIAMMLMTIAGTKAHVPFSGTGGMAGKTV